VLDLGSACSDDRFILQDGEPAMDPAQLSQRDSEYLSKVLGRELIAACNVWVRNEKGDPVVIRNAPLTLDGRPMPTLYWLVDPELCKQVSRLESEGAIAAIRLQVPEGLIEQAHSCYAREREMLLESMWPNWSGPVPSGGVGGTRQGVKCLHAHLAYWLSGARDPVGAWCAERLGLTKAPFGVLAR